VELNQVKTPQGVGLTCQPNGENSYGLRAPCSTRQSLTSGGAPGRFGRDAAFEREGPGGAKTVGTARRVLFQACHDVAI